MKRKTNFDFLHFSEQVTRSILLPWKSEIYSCLHRNWIRIFSFSNLSLALNYFLLIIFKQDRSLFVQQPTITFVSLPLSLTEELLINFSSFYLFLIFICVFQYFIRHDRLTKTNDSFHFFNGQNLLLTKHTNVALILIASLALIFAYNFIFYTPQFPQTISLLPLVTLNKLLLPLINVTIFFSISIYFLVEYFSSKSTRKYSFSIEQESLRSIIEKNTCTKCFSKILEKNSTLIHDKDRTMRNFDQNFSSNWMNLSYQMTTREERMSQSKQSLFDRDSPSSSIHKEKYLDNISSTNLFFKRTLIKLKDQHRSCHRCHKLLLIFLFKYILLTFPQHLLQMLFYFNQFSQFILKSENVLSINSPHLTEPNEKLVTIVHFLFLFSRFGDSFLLTKFPKIVRNYFPCWCKINSKLLNEQQQQTSHQLLTAKTSNSSNNDPISNVQPEISLENHQNSIWKQKQRRKFRLKFQFIPSWSKNRRQLFQEKI